MIYYSMLFYKIPNETMVISKGVMPSCSSKVLLEVDFRLLFPVILFPVFRVVSARAYRCFDACL